ncbi:hypothetical protein BpHYR1_016386 [Brachionus plicatilis]|uniref:Uncharacterized protein n=1 Tax=Brachionus plicatilis TaxID=10195 RepID=A0A3M7SWZ0_BRAPC|nr:hypothetical protein BpHYR1_016386 [Brachionus plicatilis]
MATILISDRQINGTLNHFIYFQLNFNSCDTKNKRSQVLKSGWFVKKRRNCQTLNMRLKKNLIENWIEFPRLAKDGAHMSLFP